MHALTHKFLQRHADPQEPRKVCERGEGDGLYAQAYEHPRERCEDAREARVQREVRKRLPAGVRVLRPAPEDARRPHRC